MTDTPPPAKAAFPYKTPPLPKQREILRDSVMKPAFFLAAEPGTGKSYMTIITIASLYLNGKIDGAVILAPNGVHIGWALEQLPEHMPDVVPWRAHIWRSNRERQWMLDRRDDPNEEWELSTLARRTDLFPILCMNSEAIITPLAKRAIGTFLTRRRCLMAVDESGDFMTPSAKRTRRLMSFAARAPYRRCLDGTMVGSTPFELYAPFYFLDPKIIGARNYKAMQNTYADWETRKRGDNGREFRVIARDANGKEKWKNLDQLRARIAPYMARALKSDMVKDLPPKVFLPARFFELSDEQWRLITDLRNDLRTELTGGGSVSVQNVLVQYLRFQQITCGYVPPDVILDESTEPLHAIPGPNPRLEAAVESLLPWMTSRAIVWTRFKPDIDMLAYRLREEGFRVGVYSGDDQEQKERVKAAFRAGDLNIFLANARAGGRGLNLPEGEFTLFYANYFGLRTRLQAEDRPHRVFGTDGPRYYLDLIGYRSIDMLIVRALRNNQAVADLITGDPHKEHWL